jgi:Ca-activated chloride channel family protein
MLAMAFIIMAMARPQFRISKENLDVEGIDIMMAVDISGSMLAEDFKPNRIEAAKELGINFIKERPTDCIGLVIYAGEAFTQCPITIDHNVLTQLFEEVSSGDLKDGTAIGDGLATAVDRLRYSNAVSKVVILLTDGVNNSGFIDPLTAAEIAKIYGIRVYTIGVGTKGKAPYPFQSPFGTDYQYVEVEINEDLLNEIANMTGGKYYRATDNKSLEAIYEEIDKLEKSKINITTFTNNKDIFSYFLYIAFVLLGIQFLLKYTYLKSVS